MKKLIFTTVLACILLLSGQAAFAQTNPNAFCQNGTCTYVPLEPIPLPGGGMVDTNSFPSLMSSAFKLLLGAGATIAVIMLVLGALTYMFSDIVGNKTKALGRIRGAMWAIVLLMSSYLILRTINPDLVIFKLNITPVGMQTAGTQQTAAPSSAPTNDQINQCSNQSQGSKVCRVTYPQLDNTSTWQCTCEVNPGI
jgi:hypothetical protein